VKVGGKRREKGSEQRRREKRKVEARAASPRRCDLLSAVGKRSTDVQTGGDIKTQLLVDEPRNGQIVIGKDETHVRFPTLATDVSSSSTSKLPKKLQTSNDPKQALAQLAAREARLKEMPAEKRAVIEENDRWEKAAARMEGVKVKDDEARLKKAAKRAEKEKKKSRQEWSVRREPRLSMTRDDFLSH